MNKILLTNLDEKMLGQLKRQAQSKGISVEDMAISILEHANADIKKKSNHTRSNLVKRANELCHQIGPQTSDSAQLIREDRDSL